MKVLNECQLQTVVGGKNWSVAKCGGTIGTNIAIGAWRGARAGSFFGQPVSVGAGALIGASAGAIGGSVQCVGWSAGGGR